MPATTALPAPWRPCLRGTRHMVVCGHPMAAQAGLAVLEGGGNAVDAGVAAGIALGVLGGPGTSVSPASHPSSSAWPALAK